MRARFRGNVRRNCAGRFRGNGHQNASQGTRAMGATGTYVRAGLPEVATALSVLTSEQHPLAPEGPRTDIDQPLADP
jgi:hypothetical protein